MPPNIPRKPQRRRFPPRKPGVRNMIRMEFTPADVARVKRAAEDEARSEASFARWIVKEAIASGALPDDDPEPYPRARPAPAISADFQEETVGALRIYRSLSAVCRWLILAWLDERGY